MDLVPCPRGVHVALGNLYLYAGAANRLSPASPSKVLPRHVITWTRRHQCVRPTPKRWTCGSFVQKTRAWKDGRAFFGSGEEWAGLWPTAARLLMNFEQVDLERCHALAVMSTSGHAEPRVGLRSYAPPRAPRCSGLGSSKAGWGCARDLAWPVDDGGDPGPPPTGKPTAKHPPP